MVSSPAALTELSIAISEVMKSGKFDLLVFDSLSTLKIHSTENTAIRFTSNLINKIRSKKDKGIFTCLEGDVKTNLIEQSSIYMDEVLDFKGMYKELSQERVKKIGGSLTFIVLALAALSFLNPDVNHLTGFASSPLEIETNIVQFLVLVTAVTATLMAFYKKNNPLRTYDYKNVNEPMKISNKSRLRKRFRNKIYKWLTNG